MSLTQELGRFVASLTFERLPAEAVEIARTGITDTVATMIAGAHDPAPQLLRRGLTPEAGPATLYFSGEGAAAPEAAWINGTAGHALDYDDVGCRGHVSTVLLPAILAEAETLDAGGREIFAAYVAGYETWAELARRDPGHHHVKGWHPTGIFGAIGAGAACAALRRLSPEQATMAIALAASQAGGIMANFGTMTKPFHAGRAAHAGVVSARLAGLGFTAAVDALEHPQGFLSAVSPEGRVVLLTSGLDNLTNDFPLNPAFVPFIEQTARYLAGSERRMSGATPFRNEGERPLSADCVEKLLSRI